LIGRRTDNGGTLDRLRKGVGVYGAESCFRWEVLFDRTWRMDRVI
jgi:hypothetical protein